MKKAIARVSVVPVRAEHSDKSEIVTQILYGESVDILAYEGNWAKIKMHLDGYEGWVDSKQLQILDEVQFNQRTTTLLQEPFRVCMTDTGTSLLPMGAELLVDELESNALLAPERHKIAQTAQTFVNVPYLWGGRSFFGIDCSGFSQVVYKVNGIIIPRDAYQQAERGKLIDFIEEAQPGDLAFFENQEGRIHHVGIMLDNQKIIHAHGRVRIDEIDSIGIFNKEQNKHTHKLRFIKNLLAED